MEALEIEKPIDIITSELNHCTTLAKEIYRLLNIPRSLGYNRTTDAGLCRLEEAYYWFNKRKEFLEVELTKFNKSLSLARSEEPEHQQSNCKLNSNTKLTEI